LASLAWPGILGFLSLAWLPCFPPRKLRDREGATRPFKGLIRPVKGLIRPFKGLIRT
jgi:hypothetical protein